MKILLAGHLCSPRRGSESGITWNWAWHLSKHHEVWVLAHPHERAAVERYLVEHPNPNLCFVWVRPPAMLDPWDSTKGFRGVRLHYLLWQHCVLSKARELHRKVGFDIAHHVSWGTLGAAPLLWRLPIPFVWGPVGGGQVPPSSFRHYFGSDWPAQVIRTLHLKAASFLPPLRQAAQRSAAILATNSETAVRLEAAGAREVTLYLDSGVPPAFVTPSPIRRGPSECFTLLWSGTLIRRKALPLALEALSQVKDLPVRLVVVGEGPMKGEWIELANRLGLKDRAQFYGSVEWERMPELYQRADAFIFTSLRDSFGSQVIEAIAQSLPILTLNHQGVGDFVPASAGIKVPVTTPQETVAALARAIRLLVKSPELCRRMGESAWKSAQQHTWDKRAEWMCRLYEEVVRARRSLPDRVSLTSSIETQCDSDGATSC